MQFFGALRLTQRLASRPFWALTIHTRTPVSTFRTSPSLYLRVTHQSRQISLGSIFNRPSKTPTPSALTVATIARIEADANLNPHDVGKQLTLFQALVDTGVKPGYDIVISRWERMCTFVSESQSLGILWCYISINKDPTSPLLRSDAAFQLYLTALVKSGLSSSINTAARRRDTLLNTTPGLASLSASIPTNAETTDATSPSAPLSPSTAPPASFLQPKHK